MRQRTRGFTILEMMIVIMLGIIMTQMAVKGFSLYSDQASARQARDLFNGMLARTRAEAIETGMPTMLIASSQGDSVMVLASGRIVETVRFQEEFGVDIQGSEAWTRVCMTPRGFANPSCNSFSTPVKLAFVRGPKTETLEILPMGQIRW